MIPDRSAHALDAAKLSVEESVGVEPKRDMMPPQEGASDAKIFWTGWHGQPSCRRESGPQVEHSR
jgi:hypothetical protein